MTINLINRKGVPKREKNKMTKSSEFISDFVTKLMHVGTTAALLGHGGLVGTQLCSQRSRGALGFREEGGGGMPGVRDHLPLCALSVCIPCFRTFSRPGPITTLLRPHPHPHVSVSGSLPDARL